MKLYRKEHAVRIISDYCGDAIVVKDDGVWLSEKHCLDFKPTDEMLWKYVSLLEGADAPDPLLTPSLPFPFTAQQLAAFMLHGIGSMLQDVYGSFEIGPNEEILEEMGSEGRITKEAIRAAYAAYRGAEKIVVKLDPKLETQAIALSNIFLEKNNEANSREGVFSKNAASEISYDKEARNRAKASVAEVKLQYSQARILADNAYSTWLSAMVNELLQSNGNIDKRQIRSNQEVTRIDIQCQLENNQMNWKLRIQAEATAMCLRAYKAGASPSVSSIADDLVRWCRINNITTSSGITPSAGYIKQHVLNKKYWRLPDRPKN